jgi:tripartite-type tricarboxylate transporter receptor subunit TctC
MTGVRPEMRDRHPAIHVETVASSPEAFAAGMRREIERWGKVIRDANIRVN